MYARLTRVEALTPTIRTFWLKPERPVQYTAGQYIELYVPHQGSDSRGEWREFTLSSSPTEPELAITVQFAGDNETGSSYKRALAALAPGSRLQFTEPRGDFVLPKLKSTPVFFIAGGMGITPVHSIVQNLHDTHETRPLLILQVASTADQMIFQDFFQKEPIIYNQWDTSKLGRFTGAEALINLLHPTESTQWYLSGPEPMVESLQKDLIHEGVDPLYIVSDPFPAYKAL